MKKVQVKILEVDVDKISKKLEEMGANKFFEGKVLSSFFDYGTDALSKSEKDLVLRECNGKYLFSYVEKLDQEGIPVCREHKIFTDKDDEILSILAGLGLMETSKNEKSRTTYEVDDMRIHIEQMGELPHYMEISTYGGNADKLVEWVEKLGFSEDDAKNWTGRDIWMHYLKK